MNNAFIKFNPIRIHKNRCECLEGRLDRVVFCENFKTLRLNNRSVLKTLRFNHPETWRGYSSLSNGQSATLYFSNKLEHKDSLAFERVNQIQALLRKHIRILGLRKCQCIFEGLHPDSKIPAGFTSGFARSFTTDALDVKGM
ncbi:hypothetical protein PoB_001314200 [Plakobranchus ocellatus]|uniref:Uncharacterized protein n=1 Tax=Plakobranchus ocellatus TaxID=259542 RepID=A0AAV3YWA8_9GAST|nr:hypothetical protein PoB_001314200 [Plakobranchus ocellatus]